MLLMYARNRVMASGTPVVDAPDPEGPARAWVGIDRLDPGRAKLQRYRVYVYRRLPGARPAAAALPDVGERGRNDAAAPRTAAPPRCLREPWIRLEGLEAGGAHHVRGRVMRPASACHTQMMHETGLN